MKIKSRKGNNNHSLQQPDTLNTLGGEVEEERGMTEDKVNKDLNSFCDPPGGTHLAVIFAPPLVGVIHHQTGEDVQKLYF